MERKMTRVFKMIIAVIVMLVFGTISGLIVNAMDTTGEGQENDSLTSYVSTPDSLAV